MRPIKLSWKALYLSVTVSMLSICSAVAATPAAPTCIEPGTPSGWEFTGTRVKDYQTGVDWSVKRDDKPSAYLSSAVEQFEGFGTVIQTISAEKYVGKRLQLSGWIKTKDVKDTAGLWMRIDGANGKCRAFDNMENRLIKGTTDWKRYTVVLDVPKDAEIIKFGFLLYGPGKAWANSIALDMVGSDVPTTNLFEDQKLAKEPVNLDFTEKSKQ